MGRATARTLACAAVLQAVRFRSPVAAVPEARPALDNPLLLKNKEDPVGWTFITNHGAVLALIAYYRQITAREIASYLGITERSILRIIAELEGEGYLERKKEGRVNWYVVNQEMPLRRPEAWDVAVGSLLGILLPSLAAGHGMSEPMMEKLRKPRIDLRPPDA